VGESEIFVLIASIVLAIIAMAANGVGQLHTLFFRDNPGPGMVRLSIALAMAWIAFVIWRYADPSVVGVYVVFYLILGYAFVKLFGQTAAMLYGIRTRVDVAERRNVPAALVLSAFILATGLIFGGSLWGDADPVGDDEGGWWIPVAFFLLGWGTLVAAFGLFLRREPGTLRHRLRRERNMADARAAATFLLSAGVALTDAVSGDFWGWRHGLLTFGVLALLLLAHEGFAAVTRPGRGGAGGARSDARRVAESLVYLALGFAAWAINRLIDVQTGVVG
jgi:hypothetical protein